MKDVTNPRRLALTAGVHIFMLNNVLNTLRDSFRTLSHVVIRSLPSRLAK
jgi:hypothetical protein